MRMITFSSSVTSMRATSFERSTSCTISCFSVANNKPFSEGFPSLFFFCCPWRMSLSSYLQIIIKYFFRFTASIFFSDFFNKRDKFLFCCFKILLYNRNPYVYTEQCAQFDYFCLCKRVCSFGSGLICYVCLKKPMVDVGNYAQVGVGNSGFFQRNKPLGNLFFY